MSAPGAVAITGASGFLGRALCARLVARGTEVRALVRDPAAFSLPGVARAARCDLPETIDETALAGAAAVVHCAYATRETDQARARRVNEDGMRRLLEACYGAGEDSGNVGEVVDGLLEPSTAARWQGGTDGAHEASANRL